MKNRNHLKVFILFLSIVFTFFPTHNALSDPGNGAKLWSENCARCHNMRSPQEYNPTQWKAIMAHMRVRAGLTKQESDDIYEFLASSQSTNLAPTDNVQQDDKKANTTPSGKAIYQQTCVACHGVNGKGAIPGMLDLTGKNSALLKNSDAVLLKRMEEGFQDGGSTIAMPPKGGNPSLTEADLKAVLEYMKQAFTH